MAPTVLNMLKDILHHCPIIKGCVSRLGAQGSIITAFNPLAVQTHAAQTRVLFLSLSGSGRSDSSFYNRGLPAVLERMGKLLCTGWLPNNAISACQLADFLFNLFRVGSQGFKSSFHLYFNASFLFGASVFRSTF